MDDDIIHNVYRPQCKCCEEPATVWWPAWDEKITASPYCEAHFKEAQQLITPQGPNYLRMSGYYQYGGRRNRCQEAV